jgi:chemotaxis protein MotA
MSKRKQSFDPTFLLGLLLAGACIVGGLVLEKGDVRDVTQVTAALIVLGGTVGAVVVSTPKATLISAIKRAPTVFRGSGAHPGEILEHLIALSNTARRSGTIALEDELDDIQDPFLKKAIMLVVDGLTPDEIRLLLETDMDLEERLVHTDAKVFDAAGGYAPTIGIVGAVLGLIQVMKHLDQMQEVGRGIAVAFVATVYGVSVANLLFLPIGSKLRNQARARTKTCEMIIEGIAAIQEAKNPRVMRQLLEPYTRGASRVKGIPERESGRTASISEGRKAS